MTDFQSAVEQVKAAGKSKPRFGRDPVNQAMIHHWVDAMGDANPIYVDEAAAQRCWSSRRSRASSDDSGVDDDGPRRRPARR